MKRLYFVLVLLGCITPIYSQSLKGNLVDEQKQPIGFANIVLLSLPDSAFIAGTISDEQGQFGFDKADNSEKLLQVSYLGYKPLICRVTSGRIGALTMQPDAVMLGETVITGHRPTYTMKGNNLTTNIQNTLLSNIGTGNDVLKRIPGIRIDQDKNIEVFGKGTPLIYINGRLVRDNSELEQLSSKDIAKIELITNPGAEYDAEVKSVLKIRTVKPIGEGVGGYLRAGGDYASGWNHTEQLNLNYRKGNLDLFGSIMNMDMLQKQHESATQTMYGNHTWYLDDEIDTKGRFQGLMTNLGLNYQFNENHLLGVRYDLTRAPYSVCGDLMQIYKVYKDNDTYDTMNSMMSVSKRATTHKVNAYYSGKLFDKLTLDVNWDYLYGKNRNLQQTEELSIADEDRIVTSLSKSDYHLNAVKLVASYPLGVGALKAGGEWNKTLHNDKYYNEEGIVANSDTRSEEEKAAAFLSYDISLGKTSLSAGVRYEHTQFDYFSGGKREDDECRSYDNLFPTVSFSFPIKKVNNSLSYTMKTQRPGYSQLDGGVQYSNRYMYKQGNPLLRPQMMHDITWMVGYKFLNVSLSYQYIKDFIERERSLYNEEGSISMHTYVNFKKNQSLNLLVSASPKIGFWHPSVTVYLFQPFFESEMLGRTLKHNNLMASFTWNNDFVLPKDFIFSLNMDYVTDGNSGLMQEYSYGTLDVGLRKEFLNKQLTVNLQGIDLLDTYRRMGKQYSPQIMNTYKDTYNMRKVKLTVIYRFNATRSKYKGTGAANDELRRL